MSTLTRRRFLTLAGGAALLGTGGCGFRLLNPCVSDPIPVSLAEHPLLKEAWQGLDPASVWDVHVHLAGTGDDPASGIWIHPGMTSLWSPRRYLTMKLLLNASCAEPARADASFVERMRGWMEGFPPGVKLALLAFDHFHDPTGRVVPESGAFHVPDAYAARLAREHPERFVWIASVHPYRKDAVAALEQAARDGAVAVKWLPQSMGMDPGSPLCDPSYRAMARLGLPLLCHVGRESTVPGDGEEAWANPLLLRRPLGLGVTVIAAHCASDGEARDLDQGANGPMLPAFELFARLLEESGPQGRFYGDISATILVNRAPEIIRRLLERPDWHPRLLYGSDHPLPGMMPIIDPGQQRRAGLLTEAQERVLRQVREYNPLLFHFLLMRFLSSNGQRFAPEVFETRRVLERKG